LFFFFLSLFSCNKKGNENNKKETILSGKVNVLVDETLVPIVEDQIQIFESRYDAKVSITPQSEGEIVQSLARNNTQVAVLARKLSKNEVSFLKVKIDS